MEALWIDEEDSVSINDFTTSIHRRYYYIARLSAVHNLIDQLHCSCSISSQDFQELSYLQPQHPRLKQCLEIMQITQSCDPLLDLWQEICAYKYLSDDEFLDEYSSVVYVVIHQLSSAVQEKISPEDKAILSLLLNRATNEKKQLNSSDITYRYYLIKRLKKVTELLSLCQELSLKIVINSYLPLCKLAKINDCSQEMEAKCSFKPLLILIDEFEQFQSINDLTFIYELLQLILVVEQHTLAPHFLPKRSELCAHYEHDIVGLSIEELLTSIDILTTHIEPYATDAQKRQRSYTFGMLATIACSSIGAWYALKHL